MTLQRWNDRILLVQPQPEPGLSDELREAYAAVQQGAMMNVIIDLHEVGQLTSSHLSLLLKLRRSLVEQGQTLILCSVPDVLWGIFLVTGLDTIFRFAADVTTALATVQMQQQQEPADGQEDEGSSGNQDE